MRKSIRASLRFWPLFPSPGRVTVAAGLLLSLLVCGYADPALAIKLQDTDCSKCHTGPATDLTFAGAAHEEVSCSGCHAGHPPQTKVTIPKCGKCHEGERHYAKPYCSGCHANPHMPLRIVMSHDSGDPCRECHASEVAIIDKGGSLHSGQACSECHVAHRQKPDCTECHDAHAASGIGPECRGCHRPHMPAPVLFGLQVPSRDCAPCHREAYDTLSGNSTGHNRRSCVSCHQAKHGSVPECATCHGLPHRLRGAAVFANCGECHGAAHDLQVWPLGEQSGGSGEAAVKVPASLQRFLDLGIKDEYVRDLPR
jgi:hypothetical protein